tara:strand:- start:322 stop:1581 length:1260 start_codon:yes stop_codon:yes gene_type:complete
MKKVFFIQYLFLVSFMINCSKEGDKIVAEVNGELIIVSNFKISYNKFLESNLLSDNLLNRHAFINNMIDEILFAKYATELNVDSDSIFLDNKSKIHDQLLLNNYFEKEIESEYKINETESRQLFSWNNLTLHVRHLFSKDSNKIERMYKDIKGGGSWDLIARECFRDSILKNNGGDLGRIKLGDSDPFFEFAAFSMDIGSVSRPVRTRNGYSIIQLRDKTYEGFLSEDDYLKSKPDMIGLARYYKKQFKIRDYMDSVQKKLNIRFLDSVLDELYKAIFYLNNDRDIKLDEKLLVFKNGYWNLDETIKKLSTLSKAQLGKIESKSDLEDVIKGLVVRSYFLQNAKVLGFEKESTFKADYKDLVDRDKVKFVLEMINIGLDKNDPDYEKQKRTKYFNFREQLSKNNAILIDSLVLKTMVLS